MRYEAYGCIGEIDDLPGCTQIAVSHNVFMPREQRGKGKGVEAHQERIKLIDRLGYDYVVCTVDQSNAVQRHILYSQGWKKLDQFHSTKTDHYVELWGRHIGG